MSPSMAPFFPEDQGERKILVASGAVALAIEFIVLIMAGWNGHWLSHPQKTSVDTSNYIEAQIFEIPEETHLVEQSKPIAPAKHEMTISKVVDKGREAKPDENKIQDENQTQSGAPLAPTHGPVAIFSPSPHIPAYLQDKELHVSVVIDFLVSALGQSTPRLVGSSGNEELDAIALEAAQKWQFRPGEKDHHPIDAKVRLRIVFEVK